ncbi:hypothetical protein FZC79_10365 [Rossellomorea vietnamensis]|uniref:Uncharacterized protein n=1 Tax=Rossellomorea vietnamensis TaxID=218284 RepID=A0A5D4KFQ6_9BACI|nr:hypothetical protein [Rossellomorea vietnamensis]TYR75565.1 hypothetical protein FZC79_10365 [Rossellomorea vietnamensis]
MNKRQRKKSDKRLYKAIKELNEEVVKDLGEEIEITEKSLLEAFYFVKQHNSANQVFEQHRRFVKG